MLNKFDTEKTGERSISVISYALFGLILIALPFLF